MIYIFIYKNDFDRFERIRYILSIKKRFFKIFVIKIKNKIFFIRPSITFIFISYVYICQLKFFAEEEPFNVLNDVLYRILKLDKKSIWIGCWKVKFIITYNLLPLIIKQLIKHCSNYSSANFKLKINVQIIN